MRTTDVEESLTRSKGNNEGLGWRSSGHKEEEKVEERWKYQIMINCLDDVKVGQNWNNKSRNHTKYGYSMR